MKKIIFLFLFLFFNLNSFAEVEKVIIAPNQYIAAILREVFNDKVEVISLTTNGSVHNVVVNYDLVRKIDQSMLIFYINKSFDGKLFQLIKSRNHLNKSIDLSEIIDKELFIKTQYGIDYHIWLSSVIIKNLLHKLPSKFIDYKQYLNDSARILKAINGIEKFIDIKKNKSKANIVAFHNSYNYFVKEYGVEIKKIDRSFLHLSKIGNIANSCLIVENVDLKNINNFQKMFNDNNISVAKVDTESNNKDLSFDDLLEMYDKIDNEISSCLN
jgi:ABC-type Zn uptake system ZnuABC Zn-binding protein ZnuA